MAVEKNAVQRVKDLCKQRKIPISRLERELGFGNGYISQLRKGTFPNDRLLQIANYLMVPVEVLMEGNRIGSHEEELIGIQKENPTVQTDSEVDEVTIELMDIIQNGTDEERRDMLEMLRLLKKRRESR